MLAVVEGNISFSAVLALGKSAFPKCLNNFSSSQKPESYRMKGASSFTLKYFGMHACSAIIL